ncbi:MAG: UDP-glucose/GDP-mannose dehydrogenase family protein [Patescibacteria group bacterium]
MNIAMIGTGYVGLVTGACFADFGHNVFCVDIDDVKVKELREGKIPIYEPGLDVLVKKGVESNRLYFTTKLKEAVPQADAVFIAVGTPSSRRGDGYANLQYVHAVARDIARYLDTYTVIVDKSTVPVGTARQVSRIIKAKNPEAVFDVASNPEFLREGAAIKDFTHPDRVVIGVDSQKAEEVLRRIYEPLSLSETPIVCTNIESAELIKYAANAFLAIKISFMNEISALCEEVGANVVDVARGIGKDNRIGSKFLHPGPGYGGSCFPKDTLALIRIAQEHGKSLRLVESAVEVNNARKASMVKKIRDAVGGSENGVVIAVLGLAFKPETDDMRDAPALSIIPALLEKGAIIRVHDPKAMEEAKKEMPSEKIIEYCADPFDACKGADAVVLMTEWNEYRGLDLHNIVTVMNKNPVFIDLRNVYEPKQVKEQGFKYISVGRN